ncbi:hypothetical protein EPA93_43335 [Ktedonosporobacter rubrisoli]|uniref:Uncharacterized protein n=1 Tax=Ktedonosporobacter rubrisoli TaxID=2509675 RepID=A0A4P6K3T3_KTERU|nr:hypothetical protein EPA93_43335 [Ktedonosporobacter rubrisoli]
MAMTIQVTINRCPNCRVIIAVDSSGCQRIRWSCDDWHPEVFQLLERQDEKETEEEPLEISDSSQF